jgi:hypothetical protein
MNANERPTQEQVKRYVMLLPMLESAHREMGELSRKKPDGVLNALKVRHINRLLKDLRVALGSDASLDFLELLDEETLPFNSDSSAARYCPRTNNSRKNTRGINRRNEHGLAHTGESGAETMWEARPRTTPMRAMKRRACDAEWPPCRRESALRFAAGRHSPAAMPGGE